MEQKRLYRSKKDSVIAGVSGGIGEHLNIDALWIRIVFLILALAGGGGVIIYIVFWIFVPEADETTLNFDHMTEDENDMRSNKTDKNSEEWRNKKDGNVIGGLVLITLGSLFLVDRFVPHVDFGDLWPVILVIIGVGLLINGFSKKRQQ